jgi:hypothetical protein
VGILNEYLRAVMIISIEIFFIRLYYFFFFGCSILTLKKHFFFFSLPFFFNIFTSPQLNIYFTYLIFIQEYKKEREKEMMERARATNEKKKCAHNERSLLFSERGMNTQL